MNKFIKSALALAVALSFGTAAQATQPSASSAGNVNIGSNVSGTVVVNQGGWSASQASNTQAASASVTSGITKTPGYTNVTAGSYGATATQSDAWAINQSGGAGYGQAASNGYANGAVSGTANIAGIGSGSGNSHAGTTDSVVAYTNQGGENASSTTSNFGVGLNYAQSHSTANVPGGGSATNGVSISSTNTGAVTASNNVWQGAEIGIAGLNGAATNQVSSSGAFGVSSSAAASVGSSAAFQIPTINIGPISIPVGPEALVLH